MISLIRCWKWSLWMRSWVLFSYLWISECNSSWPVMMGFLHTTSSSSCLILCSPLLIIQLIPLGCSFSESNCTTVVQASAFLPHHTLSNQLLWSLSPHLLLNLFVWLHFLPLHHLFSVSFSFYRYSVLT